MVEQETIQLNQILATGNPFPGLRPFNPDESLLFFGRDGLSDTLLEKLRATRFVAVVGTSGSGKSSLVRAGLMPALRSGFMTNAGSAWHIALFRPINKPINNLAAALLDCGIFPSNGPAQAPERLLLIEETLRRSSLGLIEAVRLAGLSRLDNLLIVADQFEELYRFEPSSEVEHPREEASAFVKLLLEATRQSDIPIYVILTMRSDYLGDSAHFWGLPEAINRGQFLIPRMDDDERREAVEGPVRIRGAKISWPLVNRLLNDAGDDPRQLPILQHALMRTWDYWEKHRSNSEPLSIDHYDNPEVGGMGKALSIHADEAYNELTDEQKVIAEKLFKRLTEKRAGKREGRLPATVGELANIAGLREEEIQPVIEAFRKEGRSFLMPPASSTLKCDTLIDISHESLISGWTRLSEWVEEEADSAKIYQRLVDDALRYPKETGLLTNPELEYALKWRSMRNPNEDWARRYRSEYGKALDDDNPPARPEWALPDDSEYDIAIRYLELSKKEHDRVECRKERKRWKYLIFVSATAIFLFVLLIVASILAKTADSERNRANVERAKADELRQVADTEAANAERERQQADVAREQALRDRTLALVAKDEAEAAAIEANRLRAQAVAAGKAAERQARRGNLLEEGISQDLLTRNSAEAVKKYEALKGMYVKSGESSKVALTEILIGTTILRSNKDRDTAFPYFERALDMAQKGTLKVTPSVFVNIGDRIGELFYFAGKGDKAAKFYDYAISTIDDGKLKAEIMIKSADVYGRSGIREDTRDAARRYDKALSFLAQDDPKRITLNISKGNAYRASRNIDEARVAYQSAANQAESCGDSVARGDALVLLGDTYVTFDRDDMKALDYYNQAQKAYGLKDPASASLASLVGTGRALEMIAKIHERTTDKMSSIPYYRQALSLYREALRQTAGQKDLQEKDLILRRRAEGAIESLRIPTAYLEDILLKTINDNGIAAGVKQYQDLKQNKRAEYDFGEDTLNQLGYMLLRRKRIAEAIEIFKLNIDAYPKEANPYDSLGEAYMIAGNKELAISFYEKALILDPKKQSAIDALKKLKGQ